MNYFDKNGTEIKAGMLIQTPGWDGQMLTEKVYACSTSGDVNDDLGILATNWDSPAARQPEYYPLSDIEIETWEIIQPPQKHVAKS